MGEERHLEETSDTVPFIYLAKGVNANFNFFSEFDAYPLKMHKSVSAENAPCHIDILSLHMLVLEVVHDSPCKPICSEGLLPHGGTLDLSNYNPCTLPEDEGYTRQSFIIKNQIQHTFENIVYFRRNTTLAHSGFRGIKLIE